MTIAKDQPNKKHIVHLLGKIVSQSGSRKEDLLYKYSINGCYNCKDQEIDIVESKNEEIIDRDTYCISVE